jgi:hypothetical protein
MSWHDVVQNVGITGLAIGSLTFLAKAIFERWFSRDLKEFEARLSAQYQTEVEKFRSELSQRAFENQTVFLRLYEKRLEIVQRLYELLIAAEKALPSGTVNIMTPAGNESFDAWGRKYSDFSDYFESHKLYISEELCTKIKDLQNALAGRGLEVYGMGDPGGSEERQQLRLDFEKLKGEIESEFRRIVGTIEGAKRDPKAILSSE